MSKNNLYILAFASLMLSACGQQSIDAANTQVDDYAAAESLCSDTCLYANDGVCDDGGEGSDSSACSLGTDCGDCGERIIAVEGECTLNTDCGDDDDYLCIEHACMTLGVALAPAPMPLTRNYHFGEVVRKVDDYIFVMGDHRWHTAQTRVDASGRIIADDDNYGGTGAIFIYKRNTENSDFPYEFDGIITVPQEYTYINHHGTTTIANFAYDSGRIAVHFMGSTERVVTYHRNDGGDWEHEATAFEEVGSLNLSNVKAIDLEGDRLAVSASSLPGCIFGFDEVGCPLSGAIRLYKFKKGRWGRSDKWESEANLAPDGYKVGYGQLKLSGNTLLATLNGLDRECWTDEISKSMWNSGMACFDNKQLVAFTQEENGEWKLYDGAHASVAVVFPPSDGASTEWKKFRVGLSDNRSVMIANDEVIIADFSKEDGFTVNEYTLPSSERILSEISISEDGFLYAAGRSAFFVNFRSVGETLDHIEFTVSDESPERGGIGGRQYSVSLTESGFVIGVPFEDACSDAQPDLCQDEGQVYTFDFVSK